jgi:hypothetical protein
VDYGADFPLSCSPQYHRERRLQLTALIQDTRENSKTRNVIIPGNKSIISIISSSVTTTIIMNTAITIYITTTKTTTITSRITVTITNKQTPWPESASEVYRPSDRRLSAKLMPTLADGGCLVVSATNPHGR